MCWCSLEHLLLAIYLVPTVMLMQACTPWTTMVPTDARGADAEMNPISREPWNKGEIAPVQAFGHNWPLQHGDQRSFSHGCYHRCDHKCHLQHM